MTTFSFIICPKKSILIEKNRFYKHDSVKQEKGMFIYARSQPQGIKEGEILSLAYWSLLQSLLIEAESTLYFLLKELKNKESEHDFSIKEYMNAKGDIDHQKVITLTKDTLLDFNTLYSFTMDK